jgi:hypothetical protein
MGLIMASDDADSRVISRRELARQLRRQAYQRAKEQRAKDPRHLAMKEAAKVQRREAYRAAKEKHKAKEATQKTADKQESAARRTAERAARDGELKKLLVRGKSPAVSAPDAPDAPAGSPRDGTDDEDVERTLWKAREPRSAYDIN